VFEDHIGGIGEAILVAVAEVGDVLSLLARCHLLGRHVETDTTRDGDITLPFRRLVARGRALDISADDDRGFLVIIATLFLRHVACLSCVELLQAMTISSLYIASQPGSQSESGGPVRGENSSR